MTGLLFAHTVPYIQESEMETEEEVDILMSSDVYSATLSTKSITFSRAQTGWLFREDKTVGEALLFLRRQNRNYDSNFHC